MVCRSPRATACASVRHHVEIQRLARRARLLGLLEHGDARGTQAGSAARKCVGRERTVEPHLQHADLRPARRRAAAVSRAVSAPEPIRIDHALGVGGAFVVEQMILPAGERGEAIHGRLHDRRAPRA